MEWECTESEFLEFCENQLSEKKFSGDYTSLGYFVRNIEFLKEVGPSHLDALKTFTMGRLVGRAKRCVPNDPESVDEILTALKNEIKPTHWKKVAKKMEYLRLKPGGQWHFYDKAVKLADAYVRSLAYDGIPWKKAEEMTIEEMRTMCARKTQNNMIKTIIAVKKFDTPRDVIAEFCIEIQNEFKY